MTVLRFFDTVAVRLTGPAHQVRTVQELWAPFGGADPPGGPPPVQVEVSDPATASAVLNRTAVEACPHPAVHAAVAAWRGGAIVAPATSGGGKSTLVTALCLAGASYVSDEALVLTADGHALPYPKPVALSRASLAALGLEPRGPAGESPAGEREHLIAAAELATVHDCPVPVRHIVVATRDPTTAGATLDPVPRREALAALVALSFNHYRDPPGFLLAAAASVCAATAWRLRYRDVKQAADLIVDALP